MTRIMGLDYGSKTVGVAISDELGITAQGVELPAARRGSSAALWPELQNYPRNTGLTGLF